MYIGFSEILSFLVGFIIGALVGFFWIVKLVQNKMADKLAESVNTLPVEERETAIKLVRMINQSLVLSRSKR